MLANRVLIDNKKLVSFGLISLAVSSGLAILLYSMIPLLPLAAAISLLVILRKPFIALVILIVVAFFGTGLSQMGIMPDAVNWLTEIFIVGLFVRTIIDSILKRKKIVFWAWPIVGAFLLVAFVSALLNNVSPINTVLFLRLILRYYLLMVVLINLEYKEDSILMVNKLLMWLFIIQIPTAIIKLVIFGQGEFAIGTYAMWGGGPSTSMPLIAIGFIMSLYFVYKKNPVYLLLAIGFIAFSLIGGKRAFIFYLPVILLIESWFLRKYIKHYFSFLAVVVLSILLIFYIGARLLPTLNPEREIWGSFSIDHISDYVKGYETAELKGKAIGRTGATKNAFDYLRSQGIGSLSFGKGPGTFMESIFESFDTAYAKQEDVIDVAYGMTGLSWLGLQTGYVGALLWFSFYIFAFIKAVNYSKNEKSTYWKAFHLGVATYAFIILLISLTYDIILLSDDTFSFTFMVVLAFSIKRRSFMGSAA